MLQGFTAWHAIVLVISASPLILWIISLVQIAKSRAAGTTIALWVLVTTLIPLIGAILWFSIGRRTASPQEPKIQSVQ